jgi:hypothetical protein
VRLYYGSTTVVILLHALLSVRNGQQRVAEFETRKPLGNSWKRSFNQEADASATDFDLQKICYSYSYVRIVYLEHLNSRRLFCKCSNVGRG